MIEQPVSRIEPDFGSGTRTVTTHPAFAQISAARVSSSGPEYLYGSEFGHHNIIAIEIKASEQHRSLSRDWYSERQNIVRLEMSEAQWASFVSSLNCGSGQPCTLTRRDNVMVPGLPKPEPKVEEFRKEFVENIETSVEALKEINAMLDSLGLPKGKAAAIRERVDKALREIDQNSEFVVNQFDRHTEKTVEKGKVELHGYMSHMLQRAGIEAITNGRPPLALEDGTEN